MKRKSSPVCLVVLLLGLLGSVTQLRAQTPFQPPSSPPSSGCCGDNCPPPGPSGPRCDHPDETFSVDSGNPPVEPFFTSDPHAVVLAEGEYANLISLLSVVKKSATKADIYTPATDLLSSSPVFLIPSGGLFGLEKSDFFKVALQEFVQGGGTLIVLGQQHGYEFSVLPVPKEADGSYKQVNGYGWVEDQACFVNAAYIDTWHPMLAGQSRSTPTLNVDGYFTVYPSSATVLLRRTANGFPALLVYPYGPGRVVVTSLYPDYAFGHSQASREEIALVRDMVMWAQAPEQLPEIRRGEGLTVQEAVTNFATTAAASAKVHISTPDKTAVVSEQVLPVSLPPGQSGSVSVPYTAPGNAALGIHPVDYELSDSQGNIIQPRAEARSGHFAVSQPPGTAYQPGSTYQIWVTSAVDHVTPGSDVTFTIHVRNNTPYDLVNGRIGIGSHEEGSEGGRWWVFREALPGINVGAGQIVDIPWTFRIDISQSIYFGLFGIAQDPNTFLVSGGLARAERGVWVIKPSVNVTVQTDQRQYRRGETANISLNIQNLTESGYATTIKVRVLDPSNVSIYSTELTTDLPPEGASAQSASFLLPPLSPLGFYTVSAEAYDTKGSMIGSDNAGFDLPTLFLSVTPILPAVFSSSNTLSFNVENRGAFQVSSAALSVSLKDPTGGEVWNDQAQVPSLQSGQKAALEFSMPIAGLVFGDYKLVYALNYEDQTNGGERIIPNNIPAIKLTFDKASHNVRETANLTVEVTPGKFSLGSVTETVSAPGLSYSDTKSIALSPPQGSQETFAVPIPAPATAGQHNVRITLTLPSGSSISRDSQITIPQSSLAIHYPGSTTVTAGDTVTVLLKNTGGVDTDYGTEKLSLADNRGTVIYQGSASGSILAGENKTLTSFQVPSQATDGYAMLGIEVRDGATSVLSSFYKVLDVDGLAATLQATTSKDAYLNTEAIAATSEIANGQFSIEGGSLKVAVRTSGESAGGDFQHFLPKGWAIFHPEGVAVGPDGSVYVADSDNYCIQRLDRGGDFLTRWGSQGRGDGQFDFPYDLAVGPGGSVYVLDYNNVRIQKFDGGGSFVLKWGSLGSGDGQFNYPDGLAVGPDGSVYVADSYNYRIQKFDAGGNFILKWGSQGSGDGQFNRPHRVAVDSDGSVYVTDYSNHRIQKFDASGNFILKWGSQGSGDGQFYYPAGVAIGPDGSVYVADRWNSRVQKFDANGNFLLKWGSPGNSGDGQFSNPYAIAVGPDGSVYVGDATDRLQMFDGDGNFVAKWQGYGSGDGWFHLPRGMTVGLDGSLYVADTMYNDRIQKIDASGSFVRKWGGYGSGDGQFNTPEDVAVGPDGSVYVVDYNYRVQKFDSDGNFLRKWGSYGTGDGQFGYPTGVAVGPDGFVYVADHNNHCVQKFDGDGNFILKWGTYGSGDGQFDRSSRVAVGPDGSVYVSDMHNSRIQKFDGSGKFLAKWGYSGGGDGQFGYPTGLAVGLDGSVYVADFLLDRIQKFDGNGTFLAKWGSYGRGNGQFDGPSDVAVAPDGTVYALDSENSRIQRLVPASVSVGTLFETTIPVTQEADTTQGYATDIGTLTATGKLYLTAELTNSLGQRVATAEHPFYIVAGDTVLSFSPNKKVYKPGETVTITGKVENKSSVAATGLILTLSSGLAGQSPQTVHEETFDIPGNGSHLFTATATADSAGAYTLAGKVTQGGSTLVEVKDSFEAAIPKVSVAVNAPDVVGNEAFKIAIEIKNGGKVEAVFGLQSSIDGQTQAITAPAGETKFVEFTHQIAATSDCTFTFTGDLEQTVTRTILYGLAAAIAVTPQAAYPEGMVPVPVTITNTGQLDETVTASYTILPSAQSQTKTYFVPKAGSVADTVYFDLADGEHQLTVASAQPPASGTATLTVIKENKAQLSVTAGSLTNGLLPLTVTITNVGYGTIGGILTLSLTDGSGTAAWNGSEPYASLPPLQSQAITFNVNPASIPAGTCTLKVDVLNGAGQQIGVYTSLFEIMGADFQITQLPGFQTVAAGEQASFSYAVKNVGNQGGFFDLHFRASDFFKTVRSEWLNPGEEKPVVFAVSVPEDLEEKDYYADHELRAAGSSSPIAKGQSKYHVTGINLAVTASLDKQYYQQGDTAQLTLHVTQSGTGSPNLAARVNYAAFADQRTFTPDGGETLQFAIPLNKITGEKLFYGIYTETGRSLHLNSLYIYAKENVIRIMTGEQVYAPGESVSVTVDSVAGTLSGALTLTGPGYTETFAFNGTAARSFTLPAVMQAGTYSINGQLVTAASETVTASHPIDVAGTAVKVKEAILDKAKYASTDTLKLGLIVEGNQSVPITLRSWVVSPDGARQVGTETMTLSPSDPLIHRGEYPLTNAKSGVHRLSYGIYTTAGTEELLLASGAETFDVGSVMFYGVATGKPDYPAPNELVSATVTAYGTMDATLELQLDGVSMGTETISFGGTVRLNRIIGVVAPGPHTLKATLVAGGVESSRTTAFTYAMSLYDSDGDGMPDLWESAHGLDPNSPEDAGLDADSDGLANIDEYQRGSDPQDTDTDNDGMADGWEVGYGFDPLADDASGDKDGDGYSNLVEFQYGSDPGDPASIPVLPSISIEPASLVLAPVRVGTTFSAAVTIRNEVAQNLIVGQIGGADPVGAPWSISDDTCSSAVMVQDSFCTFRLDFTPSRVQRFTETFDIPSNDPDTPAVSYSAEGAGMFYDDYAAGRGLWQTVSGAWRPGEETFTLTSDWNKVNVALVKNLPFRAGKISTRVKLRNQSVAGSNGWLIFARRNSANFRFVQLRPGKVLIGQQGTVGGVAFRTVSRNVAAVRVGSWTELRADIYPDGFVQVYLGGKKVASAKFATAVEGGVGVRAVRAKTSFDWFRLDDATLLPPRP